MECARNPDRCCVCYFKVVAACVSLSAVPSACFILLYLATTTAAEHGWIVFVKTWVWAMLCLAIVISITKLKFSRLMAVYPCCKAVLSACALVIVCVWEFASESGATPFALCIISVIAVIAGMLIIMYGFRVVVNGPVVVLWCYLIAVSVALLVTYKLLIHYSGLERRILVGALSALTIVIHWFDLTPYIVGSCMFLERHYNLTGSCVEFGSDPHVIFNGPPDAEDEVPGPGTVRLRWCGVASVSLSGGYFFITSALFMWVLSPAMQLLYPYGVFMVIFVAILVSFSIFFIKVLLRLVHIYYVTHAVLSVVVLCAMVIALAKSSGEAYLILAAGTASIAHLLALNMRTLLRSGNQQYIGHAPFIVLVVLWGYLFALTAMLGIDYMSQWTGTVSNE